VSFSAIGEGVWVVTAGSFPSNSYIVAADVPGGGLLVDTGLDHALIDAALQELSIAPAYIFCTHGHFDHIGTAAFFQRKYGCGVYLHEADRKTASMCNFLLKAMGMADRVAAPDLTLVSDGFAVEIGEVRARFRHTPGHTPGSCMVEIGTHLFSGDTLYARGVGLSKLPGEQPERLRESLASLWGELGGFVVHPGHGETAHGADIMKHNQALLSFLGGAALGSERQQINV
jgi:glyoxylase-like metal-dependent hydrolase (beta-lactamase superfamily II)